MVISLCYYTVYSRGSFRYYQIAHQLQHRVFGLSAVLVDNAKVRYGIMILNLNIRFNNVQEMYKRRSRLTVYGPAHQSMYTNNAYTIFILVVRFYLDPDRFKLQVSLRWVLK